MSKIYDGIMGLVVGDALGVPFEFKKRDTFKATDMVGYGTYNLPAGTWSDDSSMTLATVDALITYKGKINLDEIMLNFSHWYSEGKFTPYGQCFDIGNTTRFAINKFLKGFNISDCGCCGVNDNGNGSLMRILPLAFIPCSYNEINAVSGLTHSHAISKQGCRLYLAVAEQILKGNGFRHILTDAIFCNEYSRIRDIYKLTRDEIKSTGYVVDTLEAALWCLYHTNNYKDCVLTAVNLGGDTDTIAAVAGGLAGLLYGCGGNNGIPKEWIKQIHRRYWIEGLCTMLSIYSNF